MSIAETFFDRYADALLRRDEHAIARMYAVPSLILFPETSIVVSDEAQTAGFFAGSWPQYEGVMTLDRRLTVIMEAPHSLWVDVTWSFDGHDRERFCYQLVASPDGHRIAVLTPMALPG